MAARFDELRALVGVQLANVLPLSHKNAQAVKKAALGIFIVSAMVVSAESAFADGGHAVDLSALEHAALAARSDLQKAMKLARASEGGASLMNLTKALQADKISSKRFIEAVESAHGAKQDVSSYAYSYGKLKGYANDEDVNYGALANQKDDSMKMDLGSSAHAFQKESNQ